MRKAIQLSALLTLAISCPRVEAEDSKASDAKTVADRFYKAYFKLDLQGLPTEEQMKELASMLSSELNTLLVKARREQEKSIKENPGEKPPWIEGNLFGSLFEGMHSFTLGTPVMSDDKASFPVTLEYREGTKSIRWIDVISLENVNGEWKVWDIFFTGPWDFKQGASLRTAISSE